MRRTTAASPAICRRTSQPSQNGHFTLDRNGLEFYLRLIRGLALFSDQAIRILQRLMERIGSRLKSVEFVGDELAKYTLKFGAVTVPGALVGYAIGHDGHRHMVLKDPQTGKHYMTDKNGNLHEVTG